MLIKTLTSLYHRDLDKLKEELNGYTNEEDMWILDKGIANSAGTLCVHLIGNLNHFIGAQLGNTGYIRQRAKEFSVRNVPRTTMLQQIDEVKKVIETTLSQLTSTDLQAEYGLRVFRESMTTEYFLLHLSAHLNYHLGQINYHRRLLASK